MYLNSDMFIIVDILIVAIVALCLYIGFKKGFIYQLADLLSFVIAFIVAWFLGPLLAEHIKFYNLEDSLLEAMAQPLINNLIWFVIIVIIVKIIFAFILPLFKAIRIVPVLGSINAIGGLVTGLINGFIWVSILGVLFMTPLFKNGNEIRENTIYKPFISVSDQILNAVVSKVDPELVQEGFDSIDEYRDAFEKWLEDEGVFE